MDGNGTRIGMDIEVGDTTTRKKFGKQAFAFGGVANRVPNIGNSDDLTITVMKQLKPSLSTLTAGILLGSIALSSAAPEPNWPRFRGTNGSGIGDEGIPAEWSDDDIAWKTKLQGGHGSPVVFNGKVYLLCGDEKTGVRTPTCINAADGKVEWQKKFKATDSKKHRFNSVASTTPAVDDKKVYFTWGSKTELIVTALDHSGETVWQTDLGPVNGGHGFGASPMLFGDMLVLNNDQEGEGNGSLIALDIETGEKRWEVDRHSKRLSYSTPCAYPLGGDGKEVLMFTNWTHGYTAVDPESGKVIAEKSVFDTETKERAISSPIVSGDLVIGTCGFTTNPKHCVAVRLKEGGEIEEVWRVEKSVPHIPSPIAVGDLVFLWGDNGIVTCLRRDSGEEVWRERVGGATYYSSPVVSGDKIFCADADGTVTAIKAAEKFEILGQNKTDEAIKATPAIAGKKMFVRTAEHLIAIQAR